MLTDFQPTPDKLFSSGDSIMGQTLTTEFLAVQQPYVLNDYAEREGLSCSQEGEFMLWNTLGEEAWEWDSEIKIYLENQGYPYTALEDVYGTDYNQVFRIESSTSPIFGVVSINEFEEDDSLLEPGEAPNNLIVAFTW